jgi:hypothetical protein
MILLGGHLLLDGLRLLLTRLLLLLTKLLLHRLLLHRLLLNRLLLNRLLLNRLLLNRLLLNRLGVLLLLLLLLGVLRGGRQVEGDGGRLRRAGERSGRRWVARRRLVAVVGFLRGWRVRGGARGLAVAVRHRAEHDQ